MGKNIQDHSNMFMNAVTQTSLVYADGACMVVCRESRFGNISPLTGERVRRHRRIYLGADYEQPGPVGNLLGFVPILGTAISIAQTPGILESWATTFTIKIPRDPWGLFTPLSVLYFVVIVTCILGFIYVSQLTLKANDPFIHLFTLLAIIGVFIGCGIAYIRRAFAHQLPLSFHVKMQDGWAWVPIGYNAFQQQLPVFSSTDQLNHDRATFISGIWHALQESSLVDDACMDQDRIKDRQDIFHDMKALKNGLQLGPHTNLGDVCVFTCCKTSHYVCLKELIHPRDKSARGLRKKNLDPMCLETHVLANLEVPISKKNYPSRLRQLMPFVMMSAAFWGGPLVVFLLNLLGNPEGEFWFALSAILLIISPVYFVVCLFGGMCLIRRRSCIRLIAIDRDSITINAPSFPYYMLVRQIRSSLS